MTSTPPDFLYKILSCENWQESRDRLNLLLPAEDRAFIHFSTEEQLPRIIEKYWKEAPCYAVVKVASSKLEGRLVFEVNPGGSTRYYHLYEGSIPQSAVVGAQIVRKGK